MKITQDAIEGLCDELEKRSRAIKNFSKDADTLNEQLRFVGYAEAYDLLAKELRERGQLIEWVD